MAYILLSAKRRAYFCKSIAIEMGSVSRYFSKVSGSGVDSTLLIRVVSHFKFPLGRCCGTRGAATKLPCSLPLRCARIVAFHPRPQIASDLGRNVTRNFNPHRNRNQFPSGNEILAYGRRFKSQPASTRCDLRIASPTRPFLQVI